MVSISQIRLVNLRVKDRHWWFNGRKLDRHVIQSQHVGLRRLKEQDEKAAESNGMNQVLEELIEDTQLKNCDSSGISNSMKKLNNSLRTEFSSCVRWSDAYRQQSEIDLIRRQLSNPIKLTKRSYCDMKEVEDFLKKTKIRFLDVNQYNKEEDITRSELWLLVGSIAFELAVCIAYWILYEMEFPEKVDYDKYAYDPNKKEEPKILDATERPQNFLIRDA